MPTCTGKTKGGAPCAREAGHSGFHSAKAPEMTQETLLRVAVPDDALAWLKERAAENDRSPEMELRNIVRRLAKQRPTSE